MEKKLEKKNSLDYIENHFYKFNTFYTTIIILFIIIFFWHKSGDNIIGYCFTNKSNSKITKEILSSDMQKVVEIKRILEKM
jgi:hypothetical protein